MSRRAILSDFEKALYLEIARLKVENSPLPRFGDLTVIVSQQLGRNNVGRNSGRTSDAVAKLQSYGLVFHEKGTRDIDLLTLLDDFRPEFSSHQLRLIEKAIQIQNGVDPNESQSAAASGGVQSAYHSAAVTSNHYTAQPSLFSQFHDYSAEKYSEYVQNLVVEARRPETEQTQRNAFFQLALNCFQDWRYLETIKKNMVFPESFHTNAQDIINGLIWLDDAAKCGHDDVRSYLDRMRQVILPQVTRKEYSTEEFIDLLCKNKFRYLIDIILESTVENNL